MSHGKNGANYVVWSFYSAVTKAPSLFAKMIICAVPEEYFLLPAVKERFLHILTWSFGIASKQYMPAEDWTGMDWDSEDPQNKHRVRWAKTEIANGQYALTYAQILGDQKWYSDAHALSAVASHMPGALIVM